LTDVHDWHETFRLHAEQGRGDPFAAAVRATRMPMIITDPRQDDNPIVYTNAAFLRMTGYTADEVMGRNCRFLQGKDTDQGAVRQLREAIEAKHDISVDILNYRKNGVPFWNALYLSPVRGADGQIQFFFASQLDITDRVEAQRNLAHQQEWLEGEVSRRTKALEDALAAKTVLLHEVDHRVKNNLQMIASLLAMQTRTVADPAARAALESMLSRVESIGTVHRRLYQSQDVRTFNLDEFVRDIARELMVASGRTDIDLSLELEPTRVPSQRASPIALLLNELMTNALKHAFPIGRAGRLVISMVHSDGRLIVTLADDGLGMETDEKGGEAKPGFGIRLIRTVVRQLQGTVHWLDANPGTLVRVSLPFVEAEAEPDEAKP
jgi:PAS domain S-box-containing protein